MSDFYTIGYAGRKPEDFVALLTERRVKTLADVRETPFSRNPAFRQGPLKARLEEAGIGYEWRKALGNPFRGCLDWRERYAAYLEAHAATLLAPLFGLPKPVCLLCMERDPMDCHRSLLALHVLGRGFSCEPIL